MGEELYIEKLIEGNFISRPNRFVVEFENKDIKDLAHLKDPGRLKELLYPGAKLLLRKASNPNRKTKYDIIATIKDDLIVLINSGFHSDIAQELIESGLIDELNDYKIIRREFSYGESRIDFLLKKAYVEYDYKKELSKEDMLLEVKGCTLVENQHALFPDAPTTRGKRHLDELIKAKNENINATVLFLILKEDAEKFSPNFKTDPDFSNTLKEAQENGVNIVPFVFKIKRNKNGIKIEPLKRVKLEF